MKRKLTEKQVEELYKYRFCRRCKTELSKKLLAKRKKKGEPPVCDECYDKLKEVMQRWGPKMQKFLQR